MRKLLITNEQWAILDYLVESEKPTNPIAEFMGYKLTLKPDRNIIDVRNITPNCVDMVSKFRGIINKRKMNEEK